MSLPCALGGGQLAGTHATAPLNICSRTCGSLRAATRPLARCELAGLALRCNPHLPPLILPRTLPHPHRLFQNIPHHKLSRSTFARVH
jgi:hypothetical protein